MWVQDFAEESAQAYEKTKRAAEAGASSENFLGIFDSTVVKTGGSWGLCSR